MNKLKNKNDMIISIDAEKASDKSEHPIMTKTLEGTYLSLIKVIYDKTTAYILSGEKLKAFPLKMRKKTKIFILATFIQHNFGSSSHNNQRRKERKGI